MQLVIALALGLSQFRYLDAIHNVKTAAHWVGKAAKQTGCVVTKLHPCAKGKHGAN